MGTRGKGDEKEGGREREGKTKAKVGKVKRSWEEGEGGGGKEGRREGGDLIVAEKGNDDREETRAKWQGEGQRTKDQGMRWKRLV